MKSSSYKAPEKNWATQTGVYRVELARLQRSSETMGRAILCAMLYVILAIVLIAPPF